MTDLLLRHGEWDVVDPASASWRYLSFRVDRLRNDEHVSRNTGSEEVALVPLGGRCTVHSDGMTWSSAAASVFEGMPWCLYLRETRSTLSAVGDVEVACAARSQINSSSRVLCRRRTWRSRYAARATRHVRSTHIIKPEFPAQRLLVVEVFTPAGNWSSYPPHKHDEDHPPGEVVLEEVYYYRTQSDPPGAFAVQRLYSPQHGTDLTETVRDGDIMLVPHGYHTTAAAHGYDLYYLNGLAGDRRSMASADDPSLAWIRPAWERLERDPRVPLVTLEGRRN